MQDSNKLSVFKNELYAFKHYFNQRVGYCDDLSTKYSKGNIGYIKDFFVKHKAILWAREYNMYNEYRKIVNSEFEQYYNNILDKWVKLSKEIPLYDSLELSIFFSYLLWNGYFSKNHYHAYSKTSDGSNSGLFYLDIINGKGVCLNYSNMLKDLLLKSNYEAAVIGNTMQASYLDYKIDFTIRRNFDIKFNFDVICALILNKIVKNNGNHANVLICENDKMYIFDPTNLVCSNVIDFNKAIIIDGEGTLDLKPDLSYLCAKNYNEMKTIDKLINYTGDAPLYTKDRIYNSWGVCISLFINNDKLIDACYSDTLPDLLKISDNMDKIKKLIKTKN